MNDDQPGSLTEDFRQLYHSLNAGNVDRELLAKVYSDDAEFIDCFHHLRGLDALTDYFSGLYENVQSIRFEFHDEWNNGSAVMLTWTMHYRHPRLNSGNEIKVEGATQLTIRDRVVRHRDFVDGGELLYEHIPVLRRIIRYLKKRMA